MLIKVHTVTTQGLKPINIDIEVNSTSGIPQIIIIGMVNTAIREAKDRIVTALKHLGIRLKSRRTIVSLVPADFKKSGSSFDLAIAVGLISLYKKINIPLEKAIFIGEVSLDGSIMPVSNCLVKVLAAKELSYEVVFIPFENLQDVSLVEGIRICGVKKLNEIIDFKNISQFRFKPKAPPFITANEETTTIVGQLEAVRAITIAVAGNHHLHLVGPPGVGKTTLPQLAKQLLPNLSKLEALEVLALNSLCNNSEDSNLYQAPFRSPHHSSNLKKIIGYASQFKPGEISLAHRGILFLDELPEFSTEVLKALRTPLDKKVVQLSFQNTHYEMPCYFILLAASNPCPCGYWQTGIRTCTCSAAQRTHYMKKLSGPLLDRFDLHVTVTPLQSSAYTNTHQLHSIRELRNQVLQARKIQSQRYNNDSIHNGKLSLSSLNKYCKLTPETTKFLDTAINALKLSTRAYEKIIAVSQTIADLDNSTTITRVHCAEALNYRFEHSWPTNSGN